MEKDRDRGKAEQGRKHRRILESLKETRRKEKVETQEGVKEQRTLKNSKE